MKASRLSCRVRSTIAHASQRRFVVGPPAADLDPDLQIDLAAEKPDRKSTRLNSSHGYISYAVFCLKKTKPTMRLISQTPIALGLIWSARSTVLLSASKLRSI